MKHIDLWIIGAVIFSLGIGLECGFIMGRVHKIKIDISTPHKSCEWPSLRQTISRRLRTARAPGHSSAGIYLGAFNYLEPGMSWSPTFGSRIRSRASRCNCS
jgi:hypothetical protein